VWDRLSLEKRFGSMAVQPHFMGYPALLQAMLGQPGIG
jgi:hypothetical protein